MPLCRYHDRQDLKFWSMKTYGRPNWESNRLNLMGYSSCQYISKSSLLASHTSLQTLSLQVRLRHPGILPYSRYMWTSKQEINREFVAQWTFKRLVLCICLPKTLATSARDLQSRPAKGSSSRSREGERASCTARATRLLYPSLRLVSLVEKGMWARSTASKTSGSCNFAACCCQGSDGHPNVSSCKHFLRDDISKKGRYVLCLEAFHARLSSRKWCCSVNFSTASYVFHLALAHKCRCAASDIDWGLLCWAGSRLGCCSIQVNRLGNWAFK